MITIFVCSRNWLEKPKLHAGRSRPSELQDGHSFYAASGSMLTVNNELSCYLFSLLPHTTTKKKTIFMTVDQKNLPICRGAQFEDQK